MCGRITRVLAAMLLSLAAGAARIAEAQPLALESAAPEAFVQRGVPAEASAENAVVARERALAAGQRIAYERMAEALGLPRGLPDQQIDPLVSSIVIEQERVTPRGYSARITVNFNANRVRGNAPAGGGLAGAGPGGAGPGGAGPAAMPIRPPSPPAATVEAVARYGSLSEWVDLRRRLDGSGAVSAVEVLGIATDRARLRLSLREPPNAAAAGSLSQAGLAFVPAPPTDPAAVRPDPARPDAARPGEAWRLSLAGRF